LLQACLECDQVGHRASIESRHECASAFVPPRPGPGHGRPCHRVPRPEPVRVDGTGWRRRMAAAPATLAAGAEHRRRLRAGQQRWRRLRARAAGACCGLHRAPARRP
jgi:hypothetical protein